jgi:hypothetical protein
VVDGVAVDGMVGDTVSALVTVEGRVSPAPPAPAPPILFAVVVARINVAGVLVAVVLNLVGEVDCPSGVVRISVGVAGVFSPPVVLVSGAVVDRGDGGGGDGSNRSSRRWNAPKCAVARFLLGCKSGIKRTREATAKPC